MPEAPENVPAQARLHIGTSKKCGGNNRSQVVSQDEPSEFGMTPGQQTIDVREASGQMREHQETRDSIEAGTLCESSACKQSNNLKQSVPQFLHNGLHARTGNWFHV